MDYHSYFLYSYFSQLFLCFLWLYYQGVVHFTFSNLLLSISHGQIFYYQLHKLFWNKKTFSSFVHKPKMISQIKLDTALIKWKKRIYMRNFGRNFVIFVKYLLVWHFCCLYFFFLLILQIQVWESQKRIHIKLITATTSINLPKSVSTDHQ